MPDPQKLMNTVRRAAQLFRSTPGRKGMVVETGSNADDVLVAGDLHGNIAHFQVLLDRARLDRNPRRHLVLQELVHGASLYPNGGCKSHQLVDLVSALKCQYPDRVHVILGNHELAELLDKPILKAGTRTDQIFRLGIQTAYGEMSDQVYAAYLELFRAMPLAVRTGNRVFMSHSAPEASDLDEGFDTNLFAVASMDDAIQNCRRALHDLVWGRDSTESTARRFASLVAVDYLITGHMPCPEGHRVPNPVQLILDCSHFPACYCLFSAREALAIQDLIDAVRTL
jgi:hypothetical protein